MLILVALAQDSYSYFLQARMLMLVLFLTSMFTKISSIPTNKHIRIHIKVRLKTTVILHPAVPCLVLGLAVCDVEDREQPSVVGPAFVESLDTPPCGSQKYSYIVDYSQYSLTRTLRPVP